MKNFRKTQTESLKALLFVLLFFVLQSAAFSQTDKNVSGTMGMAASAHPLATKTAMDILARGGNAVDAAVAAAFTIGVVEPDGSGLGGGGGMIIRFSNSEKSAFINYYQSTSQEIGKISFDFEADKKTAKSILVPGTVAGLLTALETYGTMPLAEVMKPAITYAREGFPIDATLSKIILDNSNVLERYPSTSEVFLPDGFPINEGDTLRQPKLAGTLELISLHGRDGFYEGEVAEEIVREVTANGGMLTKEDLKNYQATVSKPLHGWYRGHEFITTPPPQSGASIIEALNILENADLTKWGHFSTSEKSLHFFAETFKRVSADRSSHLGDPKFNSVPINGITSKGFARERFQDIDMSRVNPPENRAVRAGNPAKYNAKSPQQQEGSPAEEKSYETDKQDDEGIAPSERWKNDRFDSWGKKKSNTQIAPKKFREKDTAKTIRDNDEFDAMYLNRSNSPELAAAEVDGEGGHTTHLCVADKDGNMVSLTQTLGNFFGSGLTAAGVLLNNGLVNFSAVSEKNKIEPGKQPRSSISPTIILDKDGNPSIALGSPGAGRIIPTVVQLISNIIDFKMTLTEANDAPRMYSQKFDEKTYVEGRVPESVRGAMERKGHTIQVYDDYDLFFGGAQMVMFDRETGVFYGSADKRRGGTAGASAGRNDQ